MLLVEVDCKDQAATFSIDSKKFNLFFIHVFLFGAFSRLEVDWALASSD
jgi:hypothetical protein